jgi:DNA integrity scanning protein DisA with diadenylate cyclase activity
MFNKTKGKLMSYVGDKGTSNRIKKITHYRNNFIEDKHHKISRFIVDYCVENNIGKIDKISNDFLRSIGFENIPSPINILKSWGYTKFTNIPYENIVVEK